jgi:hypothetical protein
MGKASRRKRERREASRVKSPLGLELRAMPNPFGHIPRVQLTRMMAGFGKDHDFMIALFGSVYIAVRGYENLAAGMVGFGAARDGCIKVGFRAVWHHTTAPVPGLAGAMRRHLPQVSSARENSSKIRPLEGVGNSRSVPRFEPI